MMDVYPYLTTYSPNCEFQPPLMHINQLTTLGNQHHSRKNVKLSFLYIVGFLSGLQSLCSLYLSKYVFGVNHKAV